MAPGKGLTFENTIAQLRNQAPSSGDGNKRDIDPNTRDLMNGTNELVTSLSRCFLNINNQLTIPQKQIKNAQGDGLDATGEVDRNQAALQNVQIDMEATAMIDTAERLLQITRRMKELWVFGTLKTYGETDAHGETNANAEAVARMLGEIMERDS